MLNRRECLLGSIAASLAAVSGGCTSLKPRSIESDSFVQIGGIEQWVSIRGRDRSRPAILFLHGGPCDAQSPHLSLFAPWEERYVVAQWDQRGTAKTFERNGLTTPNVTFEQIVQDALQVARYVSSELGRRKLILVGHSWGAILGINVIQQRPELFHVLIGTGQPVIGKDIIERMRSSAIARALAAGDSQAATELETTSALELVGDPSKFVGLLIKWTEPFITSDQTYISAPTAFPNEFCEAKLNPTLLTIDARAGGYELPIPFFVIQGIDDNRTLPDAARAFVEQVHAPAKGYTAIEGGHFAFVTNPIGFLKALDDDIRRLRIS